MYDYIVKELPTLLQENFEQLDTSRASITGHSMGGHGALTIYLKNLDKYKVIKFMAFLPDRLNNLLPNLNTSLIKNLENSSKCPSVGVHRY